MIGSTRGTHVLESQRRKTRKSTPNAGLIAFASGTNRTCDIRGASAAGTPLGVDVSKISESGIRAILKSKVPVLLDSGAFGEVTACDGKIAVTNPISDREWHRRLSVYLRISKALRKHSGPALCPRVTVVAPDQVGSQDLTLLRLAKFKRAVKAIKGAGAQVVVPLQKGKLDIADFYQKVLAVLGFNVVPAIPMKKAACSPAEVLRFLKRTAVTSIHLLGIGLANAKAASLIHQIKEIAPEIRISLDSNRIRAAVGHNRPITKLEREYVDKLAGSWSGEVDLREWDDHIYDMTELLFSPSEWLGRVTTIETFANSLTWLSSAQRSEFVHDPDAFLCKEGADDWIAQALMEQYAAFVRKQARPAARSRAVAETLAICD